MKFSRISRLTAMCAALLATAPTLSVAAEKVTTLRYATFAPPNSIFGRPGDDGIIGRWAKAVERDSDGAVKVQIMAGGTLGSAGRNPATQLKLVTDGVADMSFIIPATTPGRFPDDPLFGLPVINTSIEGSVTLTRLQQAGLMRGYDSKDFYVVGLLTNAPNALHTSKPVSELEDLKGQRVQAQIPEQLHMLKELGAAPVGSVSVAEVAESVSRGVLDGTIKDWIALRAFRIDETARHHVDLPMGSSTILIAMNRKRFESLPAKAREAIEKHSGEAFARMGGQMLDAEAREGLEWVKGNDKHTVVTLAPDEEAKWKAAMNETVEAWRNHKPENATLWDAFIKTREEVRTELGKQG